MPVNFVKISIGSKRSRLLAVAVLSVMAILLAFSAFVAKHSSAHGVDPTKKKQRGCCSDQPAVQRRMIGTYYTTEDGFQSTLILNNKGPNQIAVTPILHSRNGQTFSASPVTVGGQSASEVDLNLLAQGAGSQFRSGSFEFTYEGRLLEMGGGLRIVNAEKSLIFDEQMLEPGMKFPSSRLEAVYAVPFEDSQVSVIVTNTTAQPIIVNGDAIFAGVDDHHPIQRQLGPYETQLVNLPHGLVKKASAGAASLNHNGVKGALLAMIHIWDADRGYSEAVNFTNPSGKTTERHGAGLRLGSVNNDPLRAVIAVRNLGDSTTTVTATVPYSKQNGDTGTIPLPQVSLTPGEIKLLNTSNPQLRRNDFATAGLEIKYTGAPGSVIATASSVSQSGNHVFALPMKDPQGGLSSTGGYPWFIKESSSTVVFIKNVTDEPQQFMLSIVYPGGQWGSNVRVLDPSQTFALDVRKLRDSQEKGSDGSVLPPDATSGHVSWSYRGARNKALIGRAQTVDFSNGLSSTYECQCSCVYSWDGLTRFAPENAQINVGDTIEFVLQATYTDCFGNPMGWWNITGFPPPTLSSDNTSVAAFTGNSYPPRAIGVGPGTTTLRASWPEQVIILFSCDPSGLGCSCEALFPIAEAATNITVQAPHLTVNEVGFKNDYTITQWSGQHHVIDSPDGTEPTWKSSGNPDYPVVYKAGAKPTMFASFGVSPAPPTVLSATIRVRLGSTVIATKNNVSVSGSSITVNDIALTEVLESRVKFTTPAFTWEISFDGSTWDGMGDSGAHKIYWIYGDPLLPPFKVSPSGTEYAPLYDRALEKAVGYADGSAATGEGAKSEIIGKLNTGVETDVVYDSKAGSFADTHPLNIYGFSGPRCQCSEVANLLRGLMRSIGIDGATKYFWSGDTNTGIRWGFTYPGDTSFLPTFRVIRSAKDEVAENPHFVFHAAVLAEGKYWDPSYGTNYTSLVFDEVSNYPDPGFTTGNSKQVIRDALGSLIDQLNTNRTCPHNQ